METTKKISFGFTKLSQKPNIIVSKVPEDKHIELIDCLEEQTIKIKDAVEEIKGPLVIPMRDNSKNLLDRVRESKKIRVEVKSEDAKSDSELTLDELAAKQLMEEAKHGKEEAKESKIFALSLETDNLLAEGKEEPTLDDYDNVPISDYGLAMLRGMGWSEGSGIGKSQKIIKTIEPELRPRGMGLGATTLVNAEKKPPPVDKDGKELALVKGAYAKIIAGRHKGSYCEVLGLDDESGRIIVKTSIKSLVLSLNEFLVQPVTKDEYTKSSRIINNAKYEEYQTNYKIKREKQRYDEYQSNSKIKREKQSSEDDSDSDTLNGHKRQSRHLRESPRPSPAYEKRTTKHVASNRSNSRDLSYVNKRGSRSSSYEEGKSSGGSKYENRSGLKEHKSTGKGSGRRISDSSDDNSRYEYESYESKNTSGKQRRRSRSRSCVYGKASGKSKYHSMSSPAPESDDKSSSVKYRSQNNSDSTDSCSYSSSRSRRNGGSRRESRSRSCSVERRKKMSKKHRHQSSSSENEYEERGHKSKSKYHNSTSTESDRGDKYRKHKHNTYGKKGGTTRR